MTGQIGILEHFRRLPDFSGREDRASFWPYAALVFVIDTAAGMAVFIPIMRRAMVEMETYAREHPDQVTVTSGPGHYSMSVHGYQGSLFDKGSIATYLAVTFGLGIVLLAAAVTRRLHDSGRSGLWALMPIPFIAYSSVMMPGMMASAGQPNMAVFTSLFVSNLLYMASLIWLIVMLATASQAGANRYGALTSL